MVKRGMMLFALAFLALFALRLTYGYVDQPNGEVIAGGGNYGLESGSDYDFALSRKNYAGQKGGGVSAAPQSIDQRFEKIAALGLSSSQFDADEVALRGIADGAKALIQHEQAFGLTGQRQLQLALGVPPDSFDAVIAQIQAIGKPMAFQVNKIDKTNEYRALLAQQVSLQKSRDNLIALKSRDADLAALIALEGQILNLETQIQNLGVSVGEFDSEFEFVTIKLTMVETKPDALRNLSLLYRAKVALEWSVLAMMGLCVAFVAFMAGLALLAFVSREMRSRKGSNDAA